jgi:hypothetical protein
MDAYRQISAVLAMALDEAGYYYRYQEPLHCFYLSFKLKHSRLSEVQTLIRVKSDCFMIYSISPVRVPKEKRAEVAVYLTGCNYNLIYGNFEMDLNDGEVRCKNTLSCRESLPSIKRIEEMINLTVMLMDSYGDGLLDVIYTGRNPLQVLQEVEQT